MNRKRVYRTFIHKEAVFRICCEAFSVVTREIVRQRAILEDYIRRDLIFQHTLEPLEVSADAPEVAKRMARAAKLAGVGPMAAVAGAMAHGGDIYLKATEPIVIAIYPGGSGKLGRLAFSLQPTDTPLSICSSSGKMGHSLSLGLCDLATVVAKDAALADAVATRAANLVRTVEDVEKALDTMVAVAGVIGLLIVKDGHVGLAGRVPPLVRMGQ
jgi:ApbE superfamily uncharacterized protein (UPF0280 family)